MNQQFCRNCGSARDCKEIYRRLGNAKGPSVALKAAIAFLLPIAVFIAAFAVFDKIFAEAIKSTSVCTAISLLLAGLVSFVCVIGCSAVRQNRPRITHEHELDKET